jgi:hypothetical protein
MQYRSKSNTFSKKQVGKFIINDLQVESKY